MCPFKNADLTGIRGQPPQTPEVLIEYTIYCILFEAKDLVFIGSSIDDLRSFPPVARQRCGYQLHLVQAGQDPSDWKPMPSVGPGCREIRVRDAGGAYRVFYVATIGKRVFVLHCFEKRSQRTAKADVELGKQRYKQMKDYPKIKEQR